MKEEWAKTEQINPQLAMSTYQSTGSVPDTLFMIHFLANLPGKQRIAHVFEFTSSLENHQVAKLWGSCDSYATLPDCVHYWSSQEYASSYSGNR